jgi:hypothetical protein
MGLPFSIDDRLKFVPYKGKKLLSLDFSNFSLVEVNEFIKHARMIIDEQPPNSLLVFCDFTNTPATAKVVLALQDFAHDNKPFVKASASVGLSGGRALVLNTINRFTQRSVQAFSDPVKAKNWLVSQ